MKQKLQFARCQHTGVLQYWGSGSVIHHICKGCGEHTSYDSPAHYNFFTLLLKRQSKENWDRFYDRGFTIVSSNPEKYQDIPISQHQIEVLKTL